MADKKDGSDADFLKMNEPKEKIKARIREDCLKLLNQIDVEEEWNPPRINTEQGYIYLRIVREK